MFPNTHCLLFGTLNAMNNEALGYTKRLAILPFDHRSFFVKEFGFSEPLSDEHIAEIADGKKLVYEGFLKSLELGVPQDECAILVDDVFGRDILIDAKLRGITTLQSTEKSGTDYFQFEHGAQWQEWIREVGPAFVKALVRYNPDGNADLNEKTRNGLKELSDFAHATGYKFLIEPLVPATAEQLEQAGDQSAYDRTMRPDLTARMVTELQDAEVEPDVWKIEGFDDASAYETVRAAAQRDGRTNVGIIVLGRGEDEEHVKHWLQAGASVSGIIGFAVGRTVFLDALKEFRAGTMTREQATARIASRFALFYEIFTGRA